MGLSTIKTPGVYINEVNAFSNSVVQVATAIPAFIGYTPQASYNGQSYLNKPFKITSFVDFQEIFCYPASTSGVSPKQYSPQYYLVAQKTQPRQGDYIVINNTYYSILPDANTIYYLYNSIQFFFNNGGAEAYIVSVGTYGPSSNTPLKTGAQIVNPNVTLTDLQHGLTLLKNEQEPTMYICPEATLLSPADNALLMQSMLAQCGQMQTAISIFDIVGGNDPDPLLFMNDIVTFRQNTGSIALNYGAAYYPFIGTNIMQPQDIDFTNLFGGDVKQLAPILNPPSNPNAAAAAILQNILAGNKAGTLANNNALLTASRDYANIMQQVLNLVNMLPASGAIAGVITTVDSTRGVWEAPANISIAGAASLPIKLSDDEQAGLNIDAASGKSINAIRFFNGMGILIWGARTLDGNSQDWRYLSVRRTMIMIEQTCKLTAQAYVFQPNDKNTWMAVQASISNFLTNLWKQGGLQGASAADAFSVACGLGATMTADDILNGFMNVTVKVAVAHPAEFIVITFQQAMATS